ncbi:YqeG family HAD IIIA-type phosphatase [Candidatus Saccharibacteria bacterium]|nr:YqeG family HAD IIIA-type phosphatase [Candidatus Saccharibacteria bacterium]
MSIFRADRYFERFEEVTPEILKEEGVKLLLCDLDNTIRLHSEKEPADELQGWVADCKKAGVEIMVVSNNGRKKMMKKFCEPIGVDCMWWAGKPIRNTLQKAMVKKGFKKEETVMLGDKWSTDVLAAKFAGVRSWKVDHRRNLKKS